MTTKFLGRSIPTSIAVFQGRPSKRVESHTGRRLEDSDVTTTPCTPEVRGAIAGRGPGLVQEDSYLLESSYRPLRSAGELVGEAGRFREPITE